MPSPLKSASAFANFEGDFYLKLIAVGEADFRSSSLGNRQPSGSSSEAKALTVITKNKSSNRYYRFHYSHHTPKNFYIKLVINSLGNFYDLS